MIDRRSELVEERIKREHAREEMRRATELVLTHASRSVYNSNSDTADGLIVPDAVSRTNRA